MGRLANLHCSLGWDVSYTSRGGGGSLGGANIWLAVTVTSREVRKKRIASLDYCALYKYSYLLTYLLPKVIKTMLRKGPSIHRCWCRSMGQTDGQTDGRSTHTRSACCAGNVNSGTLCALLIDYARHEKTRYVTWTYAKSNSYMAAFLDFSVANFATTVLSKFSALVNLSSK